MTLTPADVRSTEFPAASRLRRGYSADAVDAFVERIAVRLETGAGLTSNDVYHVPLAKARIGERGYPESDVDAFLERVHGALSELEESWSHASDRGPEAPADDGGSATATDDDTAAIPTAGTADAGSPGEDALDAPDADDTPTGR